MSFNAPRPQVRLVTPIRVIPWDRAVALLLAGRVSLVQAYEGKTLHAAAGKAMPWPAVVALKKYVRVADYRVRFNRRGVIARDRFQCQYCGRSILPEVTIRKGKVVAESRTIDHVIPRAQADKDRNVVLPWNGKKVQVTIWENTVASCYACNNRKADRNPDQAGLRLLSIPKQPNPWDAVWLAIATMNIPDEWRVHMPA